MSKERRRFFRIEDSVLLQARTVSSGELKKKLDDFKLNRQQFSVRNNFNHGFEEQLADLHAIQDKMPELGRFLTSLQKQVDRLTAVVLSDESSHQQQEKHVSLSAQGISFFSDDSFKPVDVVELHLQLKPSDHQMLIYSRVVLVEDNEDDIDAGKYRISLDFEHIHDADREILIKHVHSKQLRALGTQNHAVL